MQYAPTRVHEKFGGFHISSHGYTKNAPDFIFPNRDTPKPYPVLDLNPSARIVSGRMLLRPTRVHEKFGGFWIQTVGEVFFGAYAFAPLHGYVQNLAVFIFPHTDTSKTHLISPFPIRIRPKPTRFHISAHGYAKNAPDFILSNKDTPKSRPVLHPNRQRGVFGGVCNTPLHGYMQNPSGFIFPHTDTPKTHLFLPSPIKIHPKPTRFYTQILGVGHFRGVCNTPLHGYVQNLSGFIFPASEYVKNAPDFTFPDKDTPKNPSGFTPKPSARDISGRMLLRPYTGTPKSRPILGANPLSRFFSGRMQYTPTRVRAKFGGFHISAHIPAKNAPDFTFPNKDTPKTRPVLDPNPRRETFGGVCNTPLHGYVQNLTGFTFPHPDTPKTHLISPSPIRIPPKPARFYTQTVSEGHSGAYAIHPYTDTCKIWRVLGANPCRGTFRGVCNTPLHGYMKNIAGFRPKPPAMLFQGRMQYAPTRIRAKFDGFWA